jgi:hypothetical protein
MRFALAALLALTVCAADKQPAKPVVRTVRIPFSVPGGEETAAPKAADLRATLTTGDAARVVRVRTPKDDLLLLLVMDVAGDPALVDVARTALAARIEALPKTTWCGLLRAQDGLQMVLDPTPDRTKFNQELAAEPATGKAGLLDTVQTAASLGDSIAAKSPVRVAVLYVTDSDVRNYREDFTNPVINSSDQRDLSRRFPEGLIRERISKLVAAIEQTQTPVHIVHLAYSSERLNEAYQSGLIQLAAATGGTASFSRAQSELPDVVARALEAVQSQYSAVVQLPAKAPHVVDIALGYESGSLTYRSHFVLR